MKKLISRRNFLAAMGAVAAAGALTACGGSSAVPLLLLRHPARLPPAQRAGAM